MPPRFTKEQYRELLVKNDLNFAAVGKECNFSTQRARQVAEYLGLHVQKTLIDSDPVAKNPFVNQPPKSQPKQEAKPQPKRRSWER